MGERGAHEGPGDDTEIQRRVVGLALLPNTLAGWRRRRVFRTRREAAQPEVEMRSAESPLSAPTGVGTPAVAVAAVARDEEEQAQLCVVPDTRTGEQASRSRREWARQRALAILRRNRAVEEERIEEGVRPRSS